MLLVARDQVAATLPFHGWGCYMLTPTSCPPTPTVSDLGFSVLL